MNLSTSKRLRHFGLTARIVARKAGSRVDWRNFFGVNVSTYEPINHRMTPKRIQLSRKKGWHRPPNTIVVARPSKWGNPYSVGKKSNLGFVPDIPTAVKFHREWLEKTKAGQKIAELAKAELRGKNLACWCSLDGPCHANTLIEVANG
jgi:uncharacterized protein DUF4326